MVKLSTRQKKTFQAQIWAFYRHSGRHNLPWRKTKNSYKILVSEIMLQQTQVNRVLDKYPKFLKIFPTVEALSKASLGDVLRVWQGMGYNRRAKYLHDSANIIVSEMNGVVPKKINELVALPGVGEYTANAICTFTRNIPLVFIETNIRRVYIHEFFQNKRDIRDKEILSLVEETIDRDNPREWYYALMDYGSHLPKLSKRNANTQSKGYIKQKSFKGSDREIRGKVIHSLLDKPQTNTELKKICINDERLPGILFKLKSEGLIIYEKRKYKLN